MHDDKKTSALSQKAILFIKAHQKELIERFAGEVFPSVDEDKMPGTIFMAGSPGAGKTEFSKGLISGFREQPVRIDADEIREFIPYYNGENSDVVQGAAAVGVEKLFDYVLKKKKNAILDGTFVNLEKALSNIERSLQKGRKVEIHYIYQNPMVAWQFTKAREAVEGRHVPKEAFIKAFFNAWENVKRAKTEFGNQIELNIVLKNYNEKEKNIIPDIPSIDHVLELGYTKDQLQSLLISSP